MKPLQLIAHAAAFCALPLASYADGGIQLSAARKLEQATRKAESGDAEAQSFLGMLCLDFLDRPEGMQADCKAGLQWLEKAAANGRAEAQFLLGIVYMGGHLVRQTPQAKGFRCGGMP